MPLGVILGEIFMPSMIQLVHEFAEDWPIRMNAMDEVD